MVASPYTKVAAIADGHCLFSKRVLLGGSQPIHVWSSKLTSGEGESIINCAPRSSEIARRSLPASTGSPVVGT
jgi:hypothetical protein